MSTPPTMSDSSESFNNIQMEPVAEPSGHTTAPQQDTLSSEKRVEMLWTQVEQLTQNSTHLEELLYQARARTIQAEERAAAAEAKANRAEEYADAAMASAIMRVAAPANKVKVRKPDDFDGSREKVDNFIRQLKGYLAQEPSLNAEAQLNIALGFCVGKIAGTWADRQATLIAEHKEGRLESLTMFEERVRETFGDPEKGSTARHSLRLLKQHGIPIEQFTIKFEILEADAGLDELALTDIWKDAIDRHILEKCYEALEIPKTLKDWKDRCLIYDRNFRRRAEEMKLRTSYPMKRIPSYNSSYSNSYSNVASRNSNSHPNNFNRNLSPYYNNTNRSPNSFNYYNRNTNNSSTPNTTTNLNRTPTPVVSSNSTHVPMDIDRARRPQGANLQQRPLICYKCGRPGHRRFECPENRIRAMEFTEGEEVGGDDKVFPEAKEE